MTNFVSKNNKLKSKAIFYILQAAPGSQRSDREFHSLKWHNLSIVHHFWGNINKKPADIPLSMRQEWETISKKILSQAKCYSHSKPHFKKLRKKKNKMNSNFVLQKN